MAWLSFTELFHRIILLSQLGNWHQRLYKVYLISVILTVWCEDPQERSCVRVQPEEQNHYVLYAHIDTHTHMHTHTHTHTHTQRIYWFIASIGLHDWWASYASMTFIGKAISWPAGILKYELKLLFIDGICSSEKTQLCFLVLSTDWIRPYFGWTDYGL